MLARTESRSFLSAASQAGWAAGLVGPAVWHGPQPAETQVCRRQSGAIARKAAAHRHHADPGRDAAAWAAAALLAPAAAMAARVGARPTVGVRPPRGACQSCSLTGGKADEMRLHEASLLEVTWYTRQNGRATRHSQHGTDHDSMATSYYGAKRARRSEWSPSPWWLTRATPAASARFQAAVETWYSSAVLSSPRASTQLSTS